MQIAIGRGVSRPKMMLARFFETILLVVEWHVIYTVIAVVCGLIDGASGSQITSYIICGIPSRRSARTQTLPC